MAASIQKIRIVEDLAIQTKGSETPTYTAKWYTEVDVPACGPVVETLARQSATNRLPAIGEALSWTIHTDSYTDGSAYALDFDTQPANDDSRSFYTTVTWRAPTPGNDEQPGFANQPPLQRPAEHWIEWNETVEQTVAGRKFQTFNLKGDPDEWVLEGEEKEQIPMRNTAGEPFPPIEWNVRRPVLVVGKNVKSPTALLTFNGIYQNTTNEEAFEVVFRYGSESESVRFPRFHARYLQSELSAAKSALGQTYYRMESRIEISKLGQPYVLQRFQEGNYYVVPAGVDPVVTAAKRARYVDGSNLTPPFPLKGNGDLAINPQDYVRTPYLVLFTANYNALVA